MLSSSTVHVDSHLLWKVGPQASKKVLAMTLQCCCSRTRDVNLHMTSPLDDAKPRPCKQRTKHVNSALEGSRATSPFVGAWLHHDTPLGNLRRMSQVVHASPLMRLAILSQRRHLAVPAASAGWRHPLVPEGPRSMMRTQTPVRMQNPQRSHNRMKSSTLSTCRRPMAARGLVSRKSAPPSPRRHGAAACASSSPRSPTSGTSGNDCNRGHSHSLKASRTKHMACTCPCHATALHGWAGSEAAEGPAVGAHRQAHAPEACGGLALWNPVLVLHKLLRGRQLSSAISQKATGSPFCTLAPQRTPPQPLLAPWHQAPLLQPSTPKQACPY